MTCSGWSWPAIQTPWKEKLVTNCHQEPNLLSVSLAKSPALRDPQANQEPRVGQGEQETGENEDHRVESDLQESRASKVSLGLLEK